MYNLYAFIGFIYPLLMNNSINAIYIYTKHPPPLSDSAIAGRKSRPIPLSNTYNDVSFSVPNVRFWLFGVHHPGSALSSMDNFKHSAGSVQVRDLGRSADLFIVLQDIFTSCLMKALQH